MAWPTADPTRTLHADTCNMAFGRKDPTCPRCQELTAGDAPRKGWGMTRKQMDAIRAQEIRNHDCKKSGCMIVCTYGDW